jgi:hypothetical protein
MATELTNAGYESIRDLINSSRTSPAQWDYIALVDDGGNEVIRTQISNDADASWSTDDQDGDSTSETMVVTYTITGADVSTPVTIVKSQLYDDASGSGAPVLSEDSFTSATLDADSDELTVTHKVEVPKVA